MKATGDAGPGYSGKLFTVRMLQVLSAPLRLALHPHACIRSTIASNDSVINMLCMDERFTMIPAVNRY